MLLYALLDLLFSRLTTFNEKAESYYACKASFKGIMEDLQVSDAEQIDLLVKWLPCLTSLRSLPILPLKMLPPFQVNRSAHPGIPTDVVALAWGFLRWRNGC
jgi:hypothetical protein